MSSKKHAVEGNYVAKSQPGCYVAHNSAPWTIETSPFDAEDFGLEPGDEDSIPEIIVDPDSKSLSVVNTDHARDKSFFITTSHGVLDSRQRRLKPGPNRTTNGQNEPATTLVLVVKPRTVIEACYLEVSDAQATGQQPMDLFSDVKMVPEHPDPAAWDSSRAYPFPLGGDGPYLCSQGVGGRFTHFYPGTLHALDFECPPGTPVRALAGGVVKEVRQSNSAGGIHARGLFEWNSVVVSQDDGLLAEYVHIQPESALVAVGDRVSEGQQLCSSGDAGFCPSPHLHVQVQEDEADNSPTVLFALLDVEGKPYFPAAGKWYGASGEVKAPRPSKRSPGSKRSR